MNGTDLATLLRDAVRDTHMTVAESDITRRARRLRTRRRVAVGGAVSAGLAATALAVAMLAAPASSPATGQAENTAQLTAWTVTKDPDGVIDVTIRELKDAAGLQARLRADGVPTNVSFSGPNPACVPYYPDYRYIPTLPIHYLGKPGNFYPWIHSYDNGSVTEFVPSPADLTLVVRPARMPRGTAFQIIALRGSIVAWGLVKTSPACTGLCGAQVATRISSTFSARTVNSRLVSVAIVRPVLGRMISEAAKPGPAPAWPATSIARRSPQPSPVSSATSRWGVCGRSACSASSPGSSVRQPDPKRTRSGPVDHSPPALWSANTCGGSLASEPASSSR